MKDISSLPSSGTDHLKVMGTYRTGFGAQPPIIPVDSTSQQCAYPKDTLDQGRSEEDCESTNKRLIILPIVWHKFGLTLFHAPAIRGNPAADDHSASFDICVRVIVAERLEAVLDRSN